jgi:hypothetical protein
MERGIPITHVWLSHHFKTRFQRIGSLSSQGTKEDDIDGWWGAMNVDV